MLRLRFAADGERAPEAPLVGAPGVHVWRNRRGGVVACGFRLDGYHWMYWPFLATFRFHPDDPCITAFPEPTAPADVVWDTYRRSVLPMALQANGLEALHASAVVSRSRVVAFCAASETGKSTLAYGLSRRGYPQWSDDGIVFRVDRDGTTVMPLPFRVRLRPESQQMFDGDPRPVAEFEGNGPGEQTHTAPAALDAICLLSRAEAVASAAPARVRRVAAAEAFPLVLTHAHVFDPDDGARRERMLRTYLDLVSNVPVVEVTFAPVRERIDRLLDEIVQALDLELPAADKSRRAS